MSEVTTTFFANATQAEAAISRLEKKYGKAEPRSEEEREWRWRQIMRHRSFLDDV